MRHLLREYSRREGSQRIDEPDLEEAVIALEDQAGLFGDRSEFALKINTASSPQTWG